MKELFVPYELAVLAKEKGFDNPCLTTYHPTYRLVGILEDDISFEFEDNVPEDHYPTNTNVSAGYVAAPLYQQVVDWFREKHNTVINVYANASGYLFEFHDSANKGGTHRCDSGFSGDNESGCWDNYYDAFNEALQEAFKLI